MFDGMFGLLTLTGIHVKIGHHLSAIREWFDLYFLQVGKNLWIHLSPSAALLRYTFFVIRSRRWV